MSTHDAIAALFIVVGFFGLLYALIFWATRKAKQPDSQPHSNDPVHQDHDGSWWFWEETWAHREGPFPSKYIADLACSWYAWVCLEGMHKKDQLFWYLTDKGWRKAKLECRYTYTCNPGRRTYRLRIQGLLNKEEDLITDIDLKPDTYLKLIPRKDKE